MPARKKLPIKLERKLRTFFYSPHLPTGFRRDISIYYRAVGARTDHERQQVRQWLESQPIWSLHQPIRHRFKRRRFISLAPNYIWGIDFFFKPHIPHFFQISVFDICMVGKR